MNRKSEDIECVKSYLLFHTVSLNNYPQVQRGIPTNLVNHSPHQNKQKTSSVQYHQSHQGRAGVTNRYIPQQVSICFQAHRMPCRVVENDNRRTQNVLIQCRVSAKILLTPQLTQFPRSRPVLRLPL